MLGPTGVTSSNNPSSKDFEKALDVLAEKKTLYGTNTAEVRKITGLMKNIKIIGAQTDDSVYTREACRDEMMGLVVYYGLPNLFMTINPSDIQNPIVSFWHGGTETKFNLDTLLPDFPSQSKRAQIVADDPVHACKFFTTVILAFLKSFLGFDKSADDGPLLNETLFGCAGLNAFFGTVECQNRGSLHLHMLVWLSGVPSTKELMDRIHQALCKANPEYAVAQDQLRKERKELVQHQKESRGDGRQEREKEEEKNQPFFEHTWKNPPANGLCSINATGTPPHNYTLAYN